MMRNDDFFEIPYDHTIIKSEIISHYFGAWAKIISKYSSHQNMGYADLFCGPGEFEKESIKSTPLKIIEKCLEEKCYNNKMIFYFNDKSKKYIENLKKKIEGVGHDNIFRNRIFYSNLEAGDEVFKRTQKFFQGCPCFYFIDPFGYKGISIKKLAKLMKDWGSECCFFFNYSSIIVRALKNPQEETNLVTFFGDQLFDKFKTIPKNELEEFVMKNMRDAFRNENVEYIYDFPITTLNKKFYLIYLTDNKTGLKIMKGVMKKFRSFE